MGLSRFEVKPVGVVVPGLIADEVAARGHVVELISVSGTGADGVEDGEIDFLGLDGGDKETSGVVVADVLRLALAGDLADGLGLSREPAKTSGDDGEAEAAGVQLAHALSPDLGKPVMAAGDLVLWGDAALDAVER